MSASAPKSTTDTAPELQLTEEERELLSIRTVPEFEAAQAARRRAKALAKAPESHLATVRRARKINRILGETYPYAVAELDFTNAFELLIATVLSAQTTDVRVNQVTPALFARYPDAPALAAANNRSLSGCAPVAIARSCAVNSSRCRCTNSVSADVSVGGAAS